MPAFRSVFNRHLVRNKKKIAPITVWSVYSGHGSPACVPATAAGAHLSSSTTCREAFSHHREHAASWS